MKYIPGPMFGQFSRKQGNTVASHNRNGSYIRNRVTPVNPRTALQTIIRGRVSTLSAAWRALNAAQRAGWTALGAAMVRLDSQGVSYNLTGEQAFQSVNLNLLLLGSATVTAAPTIDTPASLNSNTLTVSAIAMSLAYTTTPLAAGVKLAIFATAQLSQGINFVSRSQYRFVQLTAAAAASPANILAAYTAVFGAPVAGKKIFLRAVPISVSGFQAAATETSAIVT